MNFQKLKNLLWHLPKAIIANIYYFFPSKKLILIGVTGTDGKTTTATLLQKILESAGYKTGLISTITSPGLHTTSPDSFYLQRLFRQFVKEKYTHCVCEVTSHALDQNRYFACIFDTSLITNISSEHLDYHQTFENYLSAKTKLFSQSKYAILNRDDQSYEFIKKNIKIPYKTYSIEKKSEYQAKNIKLTKNTLTFMVNDLKIHTNSPYYYQTYNILSALAVSNHFKIDKKIFQNTIKYFPETKGRREIIPNNLDITTIVDFAHTPAALKATLSSLRQNTKGKIIIIFGATGGRDQKKRPKMGEIVSKYSDIAIITADDTRQEKIEDINKQIISGIILSKKFTYYNIKNRQDAFNQAIKLSKKGDTIIACGKGHETSILHGKTEYPWSEAEAFRTAFRLKNQKYDTKI